MLRSVAAGVLFATVLFAAKPDFTGEWKMNPAKSDFGGMPAPQIITRSIKHHDPALEYTSYQKGERGESTTQIKYSTDGQPCVNRIQDSDAKGSAKWVGDDLLIEYTLDYRGIAISSKEIWELADGGRTLVIRSQVTIPQRGEFDVKLVLDKQ
ncbi:MAG TPA: hypothetical protein VMB85_25710 [Bryobacteraceae bacterium]|jgi:hypothetical protein|nr:hypothetical protein [Bryobacteraceae bacterium]